MDLLCFFGLVFAMPLYVSVYMCLMVIGWERADLLALVCGVLLGVCYFPIGILGQVWYLIVSIPDLCTLSYYSATKFEVATSNRLGGDTFSLQEIHYLTFDLDPGYPTRVHS